LVFDRLNYSHPPVYGDDCGGCLAVGVLHGAMPKARLADVYFADTLIYERLPELNVSNDRDPKMKSIIASYMQRWDIMDIDMDMSMSQTP